MIPPFLMVRLVATVTAVGYTVAVNLALLPAAQAKNQVPLAKVLSTAKTTAGGLTKEQHIASKVLNARGLPVEELSYLLDRNKPAEARKLLANTPRHPGDEDERKWWLAACLCREQRYEESLDQFERIKTIQKAPKSVLLVAGSAYAEDQQYTKAINIANTILAKENDRRAYELRADCYAGSGNLVEASRDYEIASTLDATTELRFLLKAATMLNKAGKPEKALGLIERAKKTPRGTTSPNLFFAQADCYKALKRWQDAINSITEAIKFSKNNRQNTEKGGNFLLPVFLKERAMCYQKLGKTSLAQADLDALDKYSRGIADEMGAN